MLDSNILVENFDYYVVTSPKPTEKTTTTTAPPTVPPVNHMSRSNGEEKPAGAAEDSVEGGGGGNNTMVFIIIAAVVIIVLMVGAIGIFVYVSQANSQTNKNIKGKVKRSSSRESLASIETVASDTGKPIRYKAPGFGPGIAKAPISIKKK